MNIDQCIQQLQFHKNASDDQLLFLIGNHHATQPLAKAADAVRRQIYGDEVYVRGLIELTNVCKNNCYYCGIRRENQQVERYRLTPAQVLSCCQQGYELGFRTFVLQGGEDPYYTDQVLCDMIHQIHVNYPDCAITLSLGEKSKQSYEGLFQAGATRYLLRHETACDDHYGMLHPCELTAQSRKQCLQDLKDIGYQVGAGFMVGSPFQREEHLLQDLRYLQRLQPDMVGIGPFLPHHQTPFASYPKGDLQLTLRMVSLVRLMFPHVLLPATTALGTLHKQGRVLGLQAGANVVMPNVSPLSVRELYSLYENKGRVYAESAEGLEQLKEQVKMAGYKMVVDRGDVKKD